MMAQRKFAKGTSRKAVSKMLALSLMIASTNALVARVPVETLVGEPTGLNKSDLVPQQEATPVSVTAPPTGTWPVATGTWPTTAAGSWPATATGAWPGATVGGAAGGWAGAGQGAGASGGQWAGGAGGAGGAEGWQGGAGGGAWRIPEWTATIPPSKIAHASLGATAVLFVFPFGGMIHRIWYHYHNVWVHAAIQMIGYLLFLAAASIGLYMGAVQKKLAGFHPIMGMMLLALLTIQPFTELINYFLYRRWPRIRYIGYIHIWTGRTILLGGMVHGGLGFAYSAKLDREMPMRKGPWPKVVPIMYGIIASLVAIAYAATITWTQIRNVRRMSDTSHLDAGDAVENGLAIRLEEHTFSQVRASIKGASDKRASESVPSGEAAEAPQSPKGTVATPVEGSTSSSGALGQAPRSTTSAAAPSRMSSIKRVFRSDAL